MKKSFSLLLCMCLSVFPFCSCSSFAPDLTDEEFEQQVEIYRNRIKNAGGSLELIDESTYWYQKNGDYSVTYSLTSSTDIDLVVRILFFNTKKARMEITFHQASIDWNTDNAKTFALLIKAVTNSGLPYEEIECGVKKMERETSCPLTLNSSIQWDDYHSNLTYTERFHVNIDS